MSDIPLTRRDAADLAIANLQRYVEAYINVTDEYIGYAAAAGVVVTRENPIPVPDPIQYLTAGPAQGSQMTTMIQQFILQISRVLRLLFTRTGTWYLQANPGVANQGQAWLNYSATLPAPGAVTTMYGFVPGSQPHADQLTPTAVGYTIFNGGELASRSLVIALLENLRSRAQGHVQNNPINISYCHTNCHNNCHSSRGRR